MDQAQITGLVLSGGEGRRMGGVDKGLVLHHGRPLARHAAERLAPQVGSVMISANRRLDDYAAWGFPVHPDTLPGSPGPLAGLLSGLVHCPTPWLVSVPCDVPGFPTDLVARLSAAIGPTQADAVIAGTSDSTLRVPHGGVATGSPRSHPVFCLVRTALRDKLADYLASGERRFSGWLCSVNTEIVLFDDTAAFSNANTLAELLSLQGR